MVFLHEFIWLIESALNSTDLAAVWFCFSFSSHSGFSQSWRLAAERVHGLLTPLSSILSSGRHCRRRSLWQPPRSPGPERSRSLV